MNSRYSSMFKAYDVRGKIPDIDEKLFYLSGKALMETIIIPENLSRDIWVMYDTREFSGHFSNFFVRGIQDAGGKAIMIGMGSTDMLYAATVTDNRPGVQITASHNPKEWHGMKIVRRPPEMIGMATGLDKIRDYVIAHENDEIPNDVVLVPIDTQSRENVEEFFVQTIQNVGNVNHVNTILEQTNRNLTIVADCANGAGGIFMPLLANLYPRIKFIPLYWEPDGTFPNHPADPQNYDNLKDIKEAIAKHKADFGVAFDGDADRALMIDEAGTPIDGDFLVSAFSAVLLEEYRVNPDWQEKFNPVVVSIQPNSRCVPETVIEHDGTVAVCKQGHTFVKLAMDKFNGIYGGEYSNHHYFGELKGMDSGALPVALMIKLLAGNPTSKTSDLFARWRKNYYITELINLRIPEGVQWAEWREKLELAFNDAQISYLDGISIYYFDWKFSMRTSNTEPVVRFILETRGNDQRDEKVKHIKQVLGILD